jgi:hypothetical protein
MESIVQATTPYAPHRPDDLIRQTLAAAGDGAPMVAWFGPSEALTVPPGDLPVWPSAWQLITGSAAASADERFVAFTTAGGAIATVHSTRGLAPALSGRLIALVGMGGHRLSVMDAGEGRFLARWTCGATAHQVTVGPTTLAAFMEIVLNLDWA